jgi:endonuclease/exonuclease/phosphatase family metal-dependent hydrolase
MKIFIFIFLTLLSLNTLQADKILKIASYNVENLFDLHKSGHEYKEYVPFSKSKWNKKNYNVKLENIAKVISEIDADIIALQEVESLQALKDLRKKIKELGTYYQYYTITTIKSRSSIHLALLSKYPFNYAKELSVTSHRKFRNILEVKYTINSAVFYIFINHWKAKSGPESQRIISAKVLRKRLNQLGHDRGHILLGDFNSDVNEHILFKRKRRHNDTYGRTGINHILKTIEDDKLVTLNDLKNSNRFYLNLWNNSKQINQWTHNYRGQKEALDSIIISPGLFDGDAIDYIEGSFQRYEAEYLFSNRKKTKPYRWQMSRKKPKVHKAKGYSDHLPIFAKFRIKQ